MLQSEKFEVRRWQRDRRQASGLTPGEQSGHKTAVVERRWIGGILSEHRMHAKQE
jgi:hypothetical protein